MNCLQCKRGTVVERHNKKTGQTFYGCDRYPDCRFAVADLARLAPSSLATSSAPTNTDNADLASAVRELSLAIAALTNQIGSRNTSGQPERRDQSTFSPSISQGHSHDSSHAIAGEVTARALLWSAGDQVREWERHGREED
jgi:hypothetical protein